MPRPRLTGEGAAVARLTPHPPRLHVQPNERLSMPLEPNVDTEPAKPLRAERRGALAVAELDRPERNNAVNAQMVADLRAILPKLAKDPGVYALAITSSLAGVFSVGGDIRELLDVASRDPAEARTAMMRELQLCWMLECFSKPTVSFIDGMVMGTGVGISAYGTHRIAGDRYRFSMPETAIGYFPDCGLAHAFSRMPAGLGQYLGLTGAEIAAGDALSLGLVTHTIPSAAFPEIQQLLADAEPVDAVLDARHTAPPVGALMSNAKRIARYFDAASVAETIRRLEQPISDDRAWTEETLAKLRARSPLALCLTHRAIESARDLDIRETLLQDYRLAVRSIEGGDLREGVRALLLDKDRKPRWQHDRIESVPAELLATYFAPLGSSELPLLPRSEMQQLRA